MSLSIRSHGDDARLRQMDQIQRRRERGSQRLASGKRIATAADDPAGLAIAKRLEAQVRGSAQGERNVADGQSLLRTADGALQSSQDSLGRMRELTVQAQNGTLSASDRDAIQQEYDQLALGLDQTAGGSSFAGTQLLDGSASGGNAVVISDGGGGEHSLDLPDARASTLAVAGRSVADPATMQALDAAGATLASSRARLGAADNALASHGRQLAASGAAAEAARSRIEDVDVAQAVAEQTRDRILFSLQVSGQRAASSRPKLLDLLG